VVLGNEQWSICNNRCVEQQKWDGALETQDISNKLHPLYVEKIINLVYLISSIVGRIQVQRVSVLHQGELRSHQNGWFLFYHQGPAAMPARTCHVQAINFRYPLRFKIIVHEAFLFCFKIDVHVRVSKTNY
jgi:hypothetical protein